MYNAKHYSNKIPSTVRNAMREFTKQECQLVRRRTRGATGNGAANQCHENVDGWVKKKGGRVISGWKLHRDNQLTKQGIWVWIFHSVWLTPEQNVTDTTFDRTYGYSKDCVFWPDKKRKVDLINGTSYNTIVVFETAKAALAYRHTSNKHLKRGKAYWTNSDLSDFKSLQEHSGIYRYAFPMYPNNIRKMCREYNLKIVGSFFKTSNYSNLVRSNFVFDYSIGLQYIVTG